MASDEIEITKSVLTEVTIAAPLETVWGAVRDPAQISKWFGWDADTLEDEIDYIFASAQGSEADHSLDFGEWEGVSDRFELEGSGAGTVLRVVRTGSPAHAGHYDDVAEGWVTFLQQLRLMLERHPGQARRTLYFSGKATEKHRLPTEALGVAGLHDARMGREYRAQTPMGDEMTGTVWHETKFQLGLEVDQWGDGLLVVTDRPKGGTAPHGGGAAVLTTYGLSDATFEDLRTRWEAWWNERYPKNIAVEAVVKDGPPIR